MSNEQSKDEEVLRLYRELAAEKLRADQGWARYESANADRNTLRAEKASTVQPVAAQQHAQAALSDDEHTQAWIAVTDALDKGVPGWLSGPLSGLDSAVKAIEDLCANRVALTDLKIVQEANSHLSIADYLWTADIDQLCIFAHAIIVAIQQPAAAPSALAIQVKEGMALDERAVFEKEANDARFFPANIQFARTISPSGRDEYRNSHLQSRWEGWQARAALAAPLPVQPAAVADAVPVEATALDVMSLIRQQCHRVYASAVDREDIDTRYMVEIEEGVRALAAKPSEQA